ncbi:NlpC/P60 family protein [Kitasatospora sp. NPDC002227]|uniref:C40 family peptidase n=1 Tax=Kitasatospora sp. NPDC002227 TaxID=3154773 RepID=UPI00332A0203
MAAHRKPRGTALRHRRVATLAGVAAVSVTGLAFPAQAEPGPERIRARVDELYREAEQATQRYDGAAEQAAELQRRVGHLQDEVARKAEAIEAARARLGELAAEQYRGGGLSTTLQLALADDPQQFLQRAGMIDQVGVIEQQALHSYGQQRLALDTEAAEAQQRLAELSARQKELAADKAAVQQKLAEAQHLLAQLTPAPESGADPDETPAPATGRAAAAVAFAVAQLGKPYVWGATGPESYDCSGLVQAAWAAAGISLPRTTYAQIDAAPRVPRGELRPGDLVFFYSTVSHVGLYTGNGRMIHAPHPGAPVRYESVDVMPFAGAVRPA